MASPKYGTKNHVNGGHLSHLVLFILTYSLSTYYKLLPKQLAFTIRSNDLIYSKFWSNHFQSKVLILGIHQKYKSLILCFVDLN